MTVARELVHRITFEIVKNEDTDDLEFAWRDENGQYIDPESHPTLFAYLTSAFEAQSSAITADINSNVTLGAGEVSTSASAGFLYVPTCDGTPTGTPTAKSGFSPIVVDTDSDKLYFYSGGGWKGLEVDVDAP